MFIGLQSSLFDATTSDINLGAPGTTILDVNQALTVLVYHFPIGSGENGFGYMISRTPSASGNGLRFFISHNTGNPRLSVGVTSTTAAAPAREAANGNIAYGAWTHSAFTFDGSVNGSGFKIYNGANGAAIAEVSSYATTTNGTGSISTNNADNLHIGNRQGTDRTFNGHIAYVARWNRVLNPGELLLAQQFGPLAVPEGLVLCWANDRDWGPLNLVPASRTAINRGMVPPNTVLVNTRSYYLFGPPPAGGTAITPSVGSLTITGYAPTPSQQWFITPPAGTLTITGYAPGLIQGSNAVPGVGTLTIDGYAPSVTQQFFIVPGVGTLTITGQIPAVAGAGTLVPGTATLSLVGYQPNLVRQDFIVPGVGTISINTNPPLVVGGTYIIPGVGAANFVGYAAGVVRGTVISPAAGALLLTGHQPQVSQGNVPQLIIPGAAGLSLTGYQPTAVSAVFVDGNGRVWYLPARAAEWVLAARPTEWILR